MDFADHHRREQPDSSTNAELADPDTFEMLIDGAHHSQSGGDVGQSESIFRINQMPPEIIAYMFEFYIIDSFITSRYRGQSKGAFLLGAVCPLWRQIAWTSPTLWTKLEFLLGIYTTERQIQLAIEWLSRSGKLPLSVSLSLDAPEKESLVLPLIDVINQSLSRCREFQLDMFTSLTFSRLSQIQGPSVLRALKLRAVDVTSPLVLGLEAAPTHLTIAGIRLHILVVNWNNLTHFSASGLCVHVILYALNHAPQLTDCYQSDVQLCTTQIPPNGFTQAIHLRVKNLSLIGELDEGAFDTFFWNMTFPNLRGELNISSENKFPTTAFLDFLSRSSCPIEKLTICEAIITSEDLIDIAKALPSITALSIIHEEAHQDEQPALDLFYNALCQDLRYANRIILPDDDVLLPFLQSIHITTTLDPFPWAWLPGICYQYHFDNDICTTSPGRCLKEIHIYIDAYDESDSNVVDEGLDMSRQEFSPADLIDSWQTYFELIELSKCVKLDLKIASKRYCRADLFEHSYTKLEAMSKEAVKKLVQNGTTFDV